jgi:alkylated DNA repair dioxygenase AlkB
MIARQLTLFGRHAPVLGLGMTTLQRIELASEAWLDYAPGWLTGDAEVFEALLGATRWRRERREMYDRMVYVPRLYASLPEDGPGHPILGTIVEVLSRHYGARFERLSVALYRDGRDSVAWHGDYVARKLPTALVATVSVGAPRRFLLRPAGGGRSISFSLGSGDLLVMGGTCQRTWQHHVPKVAHAEPRIAIMFRPEWPE